MFNLNTHEKKAQMPYEKYNRDNPLGPKVDENAAVWEKTLTHRDGFEQTVTEDQIKPEDRWTDNPNPQVMEKELNAATGKYIEHRSDAAELSVPPMTALVEKIRKNREAEREEKKEPHWTLSFDDKKQNGSLPKWPKIVGQHNKPVLGNDPQRASGSNDPTEPMKVMPLIGDITTADMAAVASAIKNGDSAEYDTAMLAIWRLANDERRELSEIEKNTIVDLKIARTKTLFQK